VGHGVGVSVGVDVSVGVGVDVGVGVLLGVRVRLRVLVVVLKAADAPLHVDVAGSVVRGDSGGTTTPGPLGRQEGLGNVGRGFAGCVT
jgi:hypothetical protein